MLVELQVAVLLSQIIRSFKRIWIDDTKNYTKKKIADLKATTGVS